MRFLLRRRRRDDETADLVGYYEFDGWGGGQWGCIRWRGQVYEGSEEWTEESWKVDLLR
jgi:hypothetical protein